jgi:hypothetical protein
MPAIKDSGGSPPRRGTLPERDLFGSIDFLRKIPKYSVLSSTSLVRARQVSLDNLAASLRRGVTRVFWVLSFTYAG